MASKGTVPLKRVFEMLDHCAKGYKPKEKPHYWCILYNGKIYPNFPKGPHGGKNPDIEIGHIKKMIRFLGIPLDCAENFLPILK